MASLSGAAKRPARWAWAIGSRRDGIVILGAALFCWFIPPEKVRKVLGTGNRWWAWRIYLAGRNLPLLALLWLMTTYGVSLVRDN